MRGKGGPGKGRENRNRLTSCLSDFTPFYSERWELYAWLSVINLLSLGSNSNLHWHPKTQLVQCWGSSAGGSRETFEELPVRGHWLPSQKSQVLLWFSAAGLRAAHPIHLHLHSPAFPQGSGPSVVTKAAASANCTLTWRFASTDQLYPPARAAGFSGPALTQAGFMCPWQSPPFKEVWISAVPPGPWSFHCLSLSPLLSPEVAADPLHLLLLLPWESHFTPLLIKQFCRLPPPFKELRWFCLLSGPWLM